MQHQRYSARLGAITPEQFQAALGRFGLGQFIEAQPISTGLFGQNVFVTSTAGQWVLRGSPHCDWQFPKERFFAHLIHERTDVPVPWPYLLDPTSDIFGWQYLLMPRMPGLQTADGTVRAALSREDKLGLVRALGEMLARLSTVEWPYPGKYALESDDIVALDRPWFDSVKTEVDAWAQRARAHSDRITTEDMDWVESVLTRGKEAIEEPFTARVVLQDYNYNNTVAACEGGRWQVTGVFDLMEAATGDGERDLCRQTAMFLDEEPALAHAFLQAYLTRCPSRPGFAQRFAVYMLAERVIVWEFGQRHPDLSWLDRSLTLREWVEPYLDAIDGLVQIMK